MKPFGEVGKAGVRAYAASAGKTEDDYLAGRGEPLTPELTGSALASLALADPATVAPGCLPTPGGLRDLP